MSRLVKRGNWAVEFYDPQKGFTTRKSLGTDDAGLARRLYAEWCLRNTDQRGSLESVTVEGLLAQFYAQKAVNYPSKYVYKSALSYVCKHLQDVSLAEFRRPQQEVFLEVLRGQNLAEGTVKRVMAAISTAVTYAYERDQIPSKPHILSVQDDSVRDRTLTDDEAKALITASGGTSAERFVQIALMTGARPGAIVGLHRSQFDFEHHLLRLLPPGERQVKQKPKPTIALPLELETLAKGWQDGRVVQSDHHRTLWAKVKSVVPEDVTPYTIRHTVATELRRQGVPEWDISGFLGHQGPGSRTTGRYAHYRPDYMRAAADAMDKYWRRLNGTPAGVDGANTGTAGSEREDDRSQAA